LLSVEVCWKFFSVAPKFGVGLEADMRLMEALRIEAGQVVAFVGAGGKSAAIRRLTQERSPHSPLVVTTTTRIGLDQIDLASRHFVVTCMEDLERATDDLDPETPILLTGERDREEPKWLGLAQDLMEALVERTKSRGAILLVEADGARGKSMKAPAEYEPVFPPACDLVVPVVGLDVIGEDVASPKIHRSKRLMDLLEIKQGDRITWEHIVRLLGSSQGALKDIPSASEVRVLLNKADAKEAVECGRQIAAAAVKYERIASVLLAAVAKEPPVVEVFGRVAGIVLAAGSSSRFNGPKQLIPFRGKPLITHTIDAALSGGLEPVVVVVGSDGPAVRKALKGMPLCFVENLEPERGQSGSLKVGLEAIGRQAEAVIFLLADMPLVSGELIQALIQKHRMTLSAVIAPFANGRRGNPVLFDRMTLDALRAIEDARGGRAVFEMFPPLHLGWDETVLFDVDTEDDYARLKQLE
jgi:molybdenum cofactor cytidylyltransferase